MYTINEFYQLDPGLKDGLWAERMVTEYRRHWTPLVDPRKAKVNMDYLLSDQPIDKVRSMFKNPDKTGLSFIRVSVVEKYRNILIAEREKAGIYISLNSIDPTVVDASRKRDRELLANRKMIEALIGTLNAKIGDPPFKLSHKMFSGNVNGFDEIGLDDEEDDDLNYFFSTHWRLLQETKGELPVNYFVKHNKLRENISLWCNDILAKKAIAGQVNLNQLSGAIDMKYLAPEQVKVIWGATKDCRDAQAIGYEKNVSVQELLRHIGNEFDPKVDFQYIMSAINSYQANAFTGLNDASGNTVWKDPQKSSNRVCSWSAFLNFRVTLGYMEWKSIDQTSAKVGKSISGNDKFFEIKPNQELNTEHYAVENIYNEVTYKAYYIPTSTQTQRLYRFGKLFHQTVEGGEDEYSNFSICCFKEVGPTAVDVLKPYIEIIQQAWTKFEWMVRKAKPKGRTYNYEALVQIASNMIKEGNNASKVSALLAQFEEGINDIYVVPTVNGERIGGGGNPYFDKPNGFDGTAKDFLETIAWCNEKLAADLGVNAIREAYSPAQNDGFKLQMAALQQSRNATEYMSNMLMSMLNHMGAQTLLLCQDILKYKTSIAYRFLINAVGEDTVKALEQCKMAHHRMGIFVESFNKDMERDEMKQLTQQAYLNKEIDFAQMILINSIDSVKKAGMILAYEKRRQEKVKQKEAEQQNAYILQQKQAETQGELATIDRKGQWVNQAKNIEGQWFFKAHKVGADASIAKKEMDAETATSKIEKKKDADIEKSYAEKNMENSRSLV